MATTTTEAKGFYKLSWLQRIGFGSGDLAQNLIYQTISIWLLFFYTNVFGLKPAVAATMFLVVRLVDVLWDPVVGTLVDKKNHELDLRMVCRDGVGNLLEKDCLTSPGRCCDKRTLALSYGTEEIDDPH